MTMIEKVAAAIRSAFWNEHGSYDDMAKAAIEAMHEPSDEMLNVYIEQGHAGGLEIYNKMIDAALAEVPRDR